MATSRYARALKSFTSRPRVSVVVVVYDIPRQARRTLQSLSAGYQRHIARDEYEVIVVDNGSTPAFDAGELEALDGQFRLIRIEPPAPRSPARALNRGLAAARGEVIGTLIDGARLVTPGLLHFADHGARLYDKAVVATLGWYLGADLQRWSMKCGHDQAYETQLLDSIAWPSDGYRLFEIATMDESSIDGWVQPINESNALFMRRAMWDAIGGFDERFDLPGGGWLNLHVMREVLEQPGARLVIPAGEGNFHQFHGGVATNTPADRFVAQAAPWIEQYEAITGRTWRTPAPAEPPTYIGTMPRAVLPHFVRAATAPVYGNRAALPAIETPCPRNTGIDASVAAVIALAVAEFEAGRLEAAAAVARLARGRAPHDPALLQVLSVAGPALPMGTFPTDGNASVHLAQGKAYRLLGHYAIAAREFAAAYGVDERAKVVQLALTGLDADATLAAT